MKLVTLERREARARRKMIIKVTEGERDRWLYTCRYFKKVAIRARTQSVSDDGSGCIFDCYKRNPRCLCVHDSGA